MIQKIFGWFGYIRLDESLDERELYDIKHAHFELCVFIKKKHPEAWAGWMSRRRD